MFTRYRNLPKPERQDLWQAAWRLVVVRVCLLAGIRRTENWLGRPNTNPAKTGDHDLWHRRALALKRVAPRTPRTHCLARALALRWWMRSVGLDAQIKIGVRKGANGLESHAWVELDDTPIDETPENVATYKTLPHDQVPGRNWQR